MVSIDEEFRSVAETAFRIASTYSRANREMAEEGVAIACHESGVQAPERFLWFDSPVEVKMWRRAADANARNLATLLGTPLSGAISCKLDSRANDALGIHSSEWRAYSACRIKLFQHSALGRLADFGPGIGGQFDALELAFYTVLREIGQNPDVPPFQGLNQLAASAAWCWAYSKICLLSERPCLMRFDENNNLHCPGGPALAYRDGTSLYALNGIRVPADIALNLETLSAQDISEIQNQEVQRVVLEQFGYQRYLDELGARIVNIDAYGTLYRVVSGNRPQCIVRVKNSTPEPDGSFRAYFLRVPPDSRTARKSVAWTFDIPWQQFSPAVES